MFKDSSGNVLYRDGSTIKLKLKEHSTRTLGKINTANKTFVVYRNSKKHILFKLNAYGFNYEMLSMSKQIENVVITTETQTFYIVPLSFILKEGEFLHFKKTGFERQIFINLDKIKQFKFGN